ncbi:MAG: glycosyltransferase [Acidobacteriota bacterium]
MVSPEQKKRGQVFVVVPSYNHAPFVEQCLRSIIGQTLRPEKLVVIDDGSVDGSQEIIDKVLKDCPFDCELIARANRGICATLNQAYSISHGEFFGYLASDDVWLPRFLEEQASLLESRPDSVLAFSHAYLIDEDDRVTGSTAEWTNFADGDLQPMLLRGMIFSSPGVLYRRLVLENQRWNEDALLEDYEMYLKLSAVGEFARNPKILCAWRQHEENASKNLLLMHREMLAAQDRVAPTLGLTPAELNRIQTRMKFAAAENLVRFGFRREAAQLFAENIRAADSLTAVARTVARLAVPQSLFQWNRRRKKRNAAARFGKLQDLIKSSGQKLDGRKG